MARWFDNLGFRTKAMLGFFLVFLVMLALAGSMALKIAEARNGVKWTKHTYIVIGELNAIMAAMVDQETGLRAYLLAGEEGFLEPYHKGKAAFDTAVGNVSELTTDNPRAQEYIAETAREGISWRTGHAEKAIGLMKAPGTVEAAQQLEISGAGKTQMDAIRGLVAKFVAMEAGLLQERSAALNNSLDRGNNTIVVATLVALGVILVMITLLVQRVDRPLGQATKALSRLVDGDLDQSIEKTGRTDEVGTIAGGLVSLQEKMRQARRLSSDVEQREKAQHDVVDGLSVGLKHLSELDLTYRIGEFPREFENLRLAYNQVAESLCETMQRVSSQARSVNTQTDELDDAAVQLSSRSESQAATLEEATASLDELSKTVSSAAGHAADAETQTRENQSVAQNAGAIVREAVEAMKRIEASSTQITQIISVIDDIAFQTNLLALNAGVEAARAGDAGRGFAVVASEVRQLAQRSSESAQQIKGLIETSSSEVATGSGLVEQAGQALEDIVSRVTDVTAKISDISASSQEQANSINETNLGMRQLEEDTQRSAGMSSNVSESSSQMAKMSASMLQLALQFNVELGRSSLGVDRPEKMVA